MVLETIVVFDLDGRAIYWHEPDDRSGGYIPDSDDLWDFLWANKDRLGGYAHTHPWNGEACPSGTDLSTFAALEKGLGKHLLWPVVTFTEMVLVVFNEVTKDFVYASPKYLTVDFDWVDELRRRSGSEDPPSP